MPVWHYGNFNGIFHNSEKRRKLFRLFDNVGKKSNTVWQVFNSTIDQDHLKRQTEPFHSVYVCVKWNMAVASTKYICCPFFITLQETVWVQNKVLGSTSQSCTISVRVAVCFLNGEQVHSRYEQTCSAPGNVMNSWAAPWSRRSPQDIASTARGDSSLPGAGFDKAWFSCLAPRVPTRRHIYCRLNGWMFNWLLSGVDKDEECVRKSQHLWFCCTF